MTTISNTILSGTVAALGGDAAAANAAAKIEAENNQLGSGSTSQKDAWKDLDGDLYGDKADPNQKWNAGWSAVGEGGVILSDVLESFLDPTDPLNYVGLVGAIISKGGKFYKFTKILEDGKAAGKEISAGNLTNNLASRQKIDQVINETLTGKSNFTSKVTLTTDEALTAGLEYLGSGYREVGKSWSGVFHSADGLREFRIDKGSISGSHAPGVPHVHFGVKDPATGKYISNNHVPYID